MSAEKHSPLPWFVFMQSHRWYVDSNVGTICEATEANAHLIVRAVNCHEKLVETLRMYEAVSADEMKYSPDFQRCSDMAKSALKLAEANDGE